MIVKGGLVLIVMVLIFFLFFNKQTTPAGYKNNGFANIKASYTLPVVYNDLITPSEAQHIITSAKSSFKESVIIGGFDTSIRKSKTT